MMVWFARLFSSTDIGSRHRARLSAKWLCIGKVVVVARPARDSDVDRTRNCGIATVIGSSGGQHMWTTGSTNPRDRIRNGCGSTDQSTAREEINFGDRAVWIVGVSIDVDVCSRTEARAVAWVCDVDIRWLARADVN